MSGSREINIGGRVMTANNDLTPALRASPTFGGVTIISATYIPGASTDAGTSHVLYLVNYGTTGTVVGGTIGSVGGTAAPYTGTVPAAFTLTASQVFVDSGEYVYLKKVQQGADSDIAENAAVLIEVVDGIVTQG